MVTLLTLSAAVGVCAAMSHGQPTRDRHASAPTSSSTTAAPRTFAAAVPRTARPARAARPRSVWHIGGYSVQHRPIRILQIGTGQRRVLWIGGIHGNEPQGAVATAALPSAFSAAHLGTAVTLTIIEDLNPDGRAAHTHNNANGVDLNRNFPAHNFDARTPHVGATPLSQPESQLLAALVARERPNLVIVCHAFHGADFINYDGPGLADARRFSTLSHMPVRPSDDLGYRTPGSLGSWLGVDLHIPILTIEWRNPSDAANDWRTTKRAVLAVLAS